MGGTTETGIWGLNLLSLPKQQAMLLQMLDQPCSHLRQYLVQLPQGSQTPWQLPFQDLTLLVIVGYGQVLEQSAVVELAPGCWIRIESHTPYRVVAEEDLLLLVTALAGEEGLGTADLSWSILSQVVAA